MATLLADRVKETWTGTGTGTMSLGGAVTGFQTFVAGVGSGQQVFYTIDDEAGGWEVGIGTVTSGSPDTLSRTTVLKSSNAGALVNFSAGTKKVFNTIPASYALYGLGERLLSRQLSTTAHHLEYTTIANLLKTNLDSLVFVFHGTIDTIGDAVTLLFGGATLSNPGGFGSANYFSGYGRITRVSSTEIEFDVLFFVAGASTNGSNGRSTGLAALETGGQELRVSLSNNSIMRQLDVYFSPAPSTLPNPGDVSIGTSGGGAGDSQYLGPGPQPSVWHDAKLLTHADGATSVFILSRALIFSPTVLPDALSLTGGTPTFRSNVDSTGFPGWEWAGSGSQVSRHALTGSAGLQQVQDRQGEMYLVFRADAFTSERSVGGFITSDASAIMMFETSAAGKMQFRRLSAGADVYMSSTTTLSTGVTYVVRVRGDGTSFRMWINGVEETLTVAGGSNNGKWANGEAFSDWVLGGYVYSGSHVNLFDGKIHEVRYYGGMVFDDDGDGDAISAFLMDKWGAV